jgi:2-polyprenyl-6-methoxyphenol hydroxylase-like FAD-dependent oxidoreductase
MSTRVTGLVRDGARVAGVTVVQDGEERTLHARLVVGADGRNSTVAELVGARKYHVESNQRFGYWGFFEGADPEPLLVYHRWEGRFVIATPADGGLYQVILLPDMSFLPEFRADRDAAFMAHARSSAPVAAALVNAERVGKLFGMLRFECFMREAAGPGWVLVGDAGHFKDPAPGQGIADAFRQAEALAPVIAGAIGGSDAELDAALAAWARWRDRDGVEHHWLASDFGAAGRQPSVVVEAMRHLQRKERLPQLSDVVQHRRMPSAVFTPPLLIAATSALLRRPGSDRAAVLRELRELIATETRRRRLARKPEYVPLDGHRDAGDTEIAEEVAA